MVLVSEISNDNDMNAISSSAVGQSFHSVNDTTDTDCNSRKSMISIPQVSFTSLSIEDDERDSSPSNSLREENHTILSEGLSMCCPSSPARTHSKLNVVTSHLDEEDEGLLVVEKDTNHHSPDNNSLVDDMEDDPNDEMQLIPINSPPPPPPPPPPSPRQYQQRRRRQPQEQQQQQQQPHKFLLRQSIPTTISTQRIPIRRLNRISLHIYDLISSDALMQLPWGCVCEIGKCFNEVNSALHELGTGAYHVGIECNGIEYAYGACSQPNKTGVFSCIPKLSPGYQYRSSIDFGYLPLIRSSWILVPSNTKNDNDPSCTASPRSVTSTCTSNFQYEEELVDGRLVIKEMAAEYMGIDYDILKRNCCTFAADACVRLGVPEDDVPTWFRNLAQTGAYSHTNFVEPLQHVLSGVSVVNQSNNNGSSPYNNNRNVHNSPSKRYKNTSHEQHSYYTSIQQDPEYDGYNHNSTYFNHDHYTGSTNSNRHEPGFEVIAQRNASNTRDVVVVIDAATTYTTIGRPYRYEVS